MRITTALIGAGIVLGVATAAVAQNAPAPTTTNPNTRVYAYKKTAPMRSNAGSATLKASSPYENGNPAPYGTNKWWEIRDRIQDGGGGGP